jgi:hypothetical protein
VVDAGVAAVQQPLGAALVIDDAAGEAGSALYSGLVLVGCWTADVLVSLE